MEHRGSGLVVDDSLITVVSCVCSYQIQLTRGYLNSGGVHVAYLAPILHIADSILRVPYSTYYKPMGDLPYISSEQGSGLIIHHGLIMRITIYKRPIPIQ